MIGAAGKRTFNNAFTAYSRQRRAVGVAAIKCSCPGASFRLKITPGEVIAPSMGGKRGAGYGLAGASGTTAGTPSGLMLKARKVNGSLPGLPH